MTAIKTQILTERDFSRMQSEWTDCLSRSDANPLFSSWPWLYSWWENWSRRLNLSLLLIGAFDQDNRLMGIGPFFRHRFPMPVGGSVNRLHVLGNAWRIGPTVRSEYTSIIADRSCQAEVLSALLNHLKKERWAELIISDIEAGYLNCLNSQVRVDLPQVSLLERGVDQGVCIETVGDWQGWLQSLGASTRLKLFNRRAFLEAKGKLRSTCFDGVTGVLAFFDLLNKYHLERWGAPAFDQSAIEFHLSFRRRLSADQKVFFRALTFDDEVISVLYDVRADGRIYNLQSGYRQDFDRKVSLGTLHLGYAIEQAFADPEVEMYDLLAGAGKNTFYKEHFHGASVEFRTVHFVRNPFLRTMYSHHARLPTEFGRKIRKYLRL